VVETDGLENRCTLTGTGGSNPSPSAIISERSFGSLCSLRISARGSYAAKTPQLENRCTLTGTGGSNPSPSAIQSAGQRNVL
jgi:hypothetical protein